MITRVGMAPRRVGMTTKEFHDYWLRQHSHVARGVPGLQRYIQNHAVLSEDGAPLHPYPGFDACSEIDVEDLETMDRAFASAEYNGAVRADEEAFIDRVRFSLLLCRREVLVDSAVPESAVKLLTFCRFDARSTAAASRDRLAGSYAEAVSQAGVLRHEQLVVLRQAHSGRIPPVCDLVDVLWFQDATRAREFPTSEAGLEASAALAGHVFGTERLAARAVAILGTDGTMG